MKKLFVVLFTLFFIYGCPLTELSDTQEYAFKKIARSAGIFIAIEKPEDVQEAISYCEYIKTLKTGALKEAALEVAMKYIKKKYGNSFKAVLLIGEVADLISYAVPDESGLNFDTKLLDMAVDSFLSGLKLAQ